MLKMNRIIVCATAILMLGAFDSWAQPGGGRGGGERGDRGGRRGAMMAMRNVPIEQIFGFLAFDDKVALDKAQLAKVRDELKVIHTERAGLLKKLTGEANQETAMTEVRKLRAQMTQKLSSVLKPEQVKALKTYMQNMNQRGGRGGQGGRGGGQRREGGGRRGGA